MKNLILVAVSVCLFAGCATSKAPKKTTLQEFTSLKITGNIVSREKLSKGGKLAFTDLKAGPLAIADEQTDRVAIKIIQGVTSALLENTVGIETTNDPHSANMVLEGYIEEFYTPGKFSKTVLFKNTSRISISGEVYERRTGLRILSFAASKTFNTAKENAQQAALSIGEAIGQYILSHAVKEQP